MTARVLRDDSGNMTIVAAAISAALFALLGVAALAASQVIASHRAQVAADMSAVAGAYALVGAAPSGSAAGGTAGGAGADQPCSVAGEVASRNAARLADCQIEGGDVTVQVAFRERTATARAGPL